MSLKGYLDQIEKNIKADFAKRNVIMKLEVGEWYKTRNGRKAFVAYYNDTMTDMYASRFGGFVVGERSAYQWFEHGNYYENYSEFISDLIEKWKEPKTGEAWVNIYDNDYKPYCTKYLDDAKVTADKDIRNCIARIKVTWTEGQFDE